MSAPSQATGKEDASAPQTTSARRRSAKGGFEPVDVMLEHSRWNHFGWTVFCVLLGALLIVKLGTMGKGAGVLLLLFAGYRGYKFGRTLLVPSGTIAIHADQVELPRGLCRGRAESFPSHEIRHAFLLRRAVPWTTTGPILVVEVGDRAFTYPRDWFLSESDQHRIARAVHALQQKQAEA